MARVRISVVLPTYRRPHLARELLGALAGQTRLPDEVVVVSQTADGTPDPELSALTGLPFALRLLHFPALGTSRARNRGAELARGDILLFLDDDVIVPETLVGTYEHLFDELPLADVIHGGIRPTDRALPDQRTFRLIDDAVSRFLASPNSARRRMTAGLGSGNFAIRRERFFRVGGFDENYSGTGDDKDLGYRLFSDGAMMFYDPGPTVEHRRAASGGIRLDAPSFWARILRPDPAPGVIYLYSKNFRGVPASDLVWRRALGCFVPRARDPLRPLKSPVLLVRLLRSYLAARRMLRRGPSYSSGPSAEATIETTPTPSPPQVPAH